MPRPNRSKRKPARPRAAGMRLDWRGLVDTPNVQADARHVRHYKAETLQNAVVKIVQTRDVLILPAVRALDPGAAINSITFDLIQEFAHALVFRAAAQPKGRKPILFRLLAAKDDADHSRALRRTWKALKHAYDRDPDQVLRPLTHGTVFLPDRHRRVEKGREIFCMTTGLLPGANPLCIARGGRFAEQLAAPKLLSAAEEADVRSRLIELAARAYDPRSQTGILLPDLQSDQVEIRRKGKTATAVLALPDGLRTRLTVPRFVHELVTWEAAGFGTTVRVRPQSLDDFRDALIAAVGRDTADDWLSRYKRSVVQQKLPAVPPLLPEDLTSIGIP